jgi:hypothetical protein
MDGAAESFIADFVRETYLSFTTPHEKHGSWRLRRSVPGSKRSTTGTGKNRRGHGSAARAVV